ncbi:MAG: fatty acid desaturase [Thalassotalea sp.]
MRTLTANENIQAIVQVIKKEEIKLKNKYAILAYQNLLGLSIFIISLISFIYVSNLYYSNVIPAWFTIIVIAVITSIAHELEHDLIHRQYFNKTPLLHNFMLLTVWLMRPNTINPWYRRKIHLNHHKVSGTQQDLEERLVGNGTKQPLLRILVICDGLLGLIINRVRFNKEITDFNFLRVFNAGFPITIIYYTLFYSWVIFHSLNYFSLADEVISSQILTLVPLLNFIMVVWILPNWIRAISLNFITSSMHYYGGVNNLLQQTQVLNHWLFMPFQWFCFNFGNTHSIHHFVPNQPFYIRQIICKEVQQSMKKHGVRFNDLASIKQANNYLS